MLEAQHLPKGWVFSTLGGVCSTVYRYPTFYGFSAAPEGIPIVRGEHLRNRQINVSESEPTRIPQEISDQFPKTKLEEGDLVVSVRGSIGTWAEARAENSGWQISPNLLRIQPNRKRVDHSFFKFVFDEHIKRLVHRSVQSQALPALGAGDIKEMRLALPPLPEQRKIAEILRTWDEALEKLGTLRAGKARWLDGLAARLIHDEQAERLHLRDFLREVSTRNRGQQVDRVLSVTNSAGFVLAEDQFAHRVASADLSNYKIVRRGHYAYNPSRINVGSIARLDAWEDGALSPMYVVFQVRDGLDSDFFGHWLRSGEARQRIALAAQGSVRETVSFGDLGSILIPVPTIDRQQAISRVLNAGRDEIALIDTEIEALTRQKRGLMQKLLTGEWRVKLEAPVA